MKFIVIFGPPAVGKMTVGQELCALTGFKLLHNHMTIDLALSFFEYGSKRFSKLNSFLRNEIFEQVAASDLPGLIFTYAWDLSFPSDKEYVDSVSEKFSSRGADVYYVELSAALDVRLCRNKQPSRLAAKPSKRDTLKSEERLFDLRPNLVPTSE